MSFSIVENRYYKHTSGRTASIYGALPIGDGWHVEVSGYTIRWEDGTIGIPHGVASRMTKEERQNRAFVEGVAHTATANGFRGFGDYAR